MGKPMQISSENFTMQTINHLGIVAATGKDLRIAELINEAIPPKDPRRIVSTGHSAMAMILNGLGFSNHRLYMVSDFFQNKPIDRLLGEGIEADHLNDDTLGKALDEIAEYGASRLFGEVALKIALEHKLIDKFARIDTTSFSLQGAYDSESLEEQVIQVTHGYSKDNKPDLKQVILSLTMTGPSFPIWMQPLSGNASDKTSLLETLQAMREFRKELKNPCDSSLIHIADSALYSAEGLLKQADFFWVTRVPETLSEVKALVSQPDHKISWQPSKIEGYRSSEVESEYGGVKQRWLLVFSEQAFQREKKTFEKRLLKKTEALEKALWHLGNQKFQNSEDAEKELLSLMKGYPLHKATFEIETITRQEKRGRPKLGAKTVQIGYKINSKISLNKLKVQKSLNKKGRFILATNQMSSQSLPGEKILSEYKEQQQVERGFRFLKDPWFLVNQIFLKSPKRIEALMAIMTLCLLVYNVAQHRLRQALKKAKQTVPNQLKKPIQNPTMRWVFQMFEDILVLKIKNTAGNVVQELVSNLKVHHIRIIKLMGVNACQIYQIS
jgi:transposase